MEKEVTIGIEQLLTPDILKPARYLGNELGAKHKSWEDGTVRWVLTYPEVYELGASNLGHIILYNILNAQPQQVCDRTYLPAPDLTKKLRETNTPLFALESRRCLTEFDIIGFSLSYELGATNILEMLDLAHIPLTWKERSSTNYPLIFAGGQSATSNPEPYADFFDFVALGDGEELLPEIGLIVAEGKATGLTREELLLDLAQIPGVYVPQFYDVDAHGAVYPNRRDVPKRILRRVATPIPAYSIGLVPYIETIHDRLVLEIRRGCTRGCRFCQPGMLTRPARDVEPQQVIDTIEKGIQATGYNDISLLSLSCSDYLALPAVGMEIHNRLQEQNISLSLPSQRVDRFDENIAKIIGGTRKSGITFAPEAGTQRMRDVINKGLTNEELLRGVKTAVEQGWDKVKLYFMIGLPGETDLDVIGIAETVRWLRQECRMTDRKRLDFNITISNFTPKPHTPFQWHSVSTSEFKRKQHLLRQEFNKLRGIKVNYTDVKISAMEDFVGRGDRKLASVVHRAWELGAGMDSWWENIGKAYSAWAQAIDEAGLTWKYRQVENGEWNVFNHDSQLFANVIPKEGKPNEASNHDSSGSETHNDSLETFAYNYDAPLPWDHINTGIDKNWLKADLQKALQAATVPDCAFDGCSSCGICGVDFGHNIVMTPPPMPEFSGEFQPNQNRVQRLRVWFGKQGEMALVSHLDLVRLFDRVVRRARLPVSYTGGFHPGPRISIAIALSLGLTSSSEIVDFELTTRIPLAEFQQQLKAQLPQHIPIYKIEEIELKAPPCSVLLEQVEYIITVTSETISPSLNQWQAWVDTINQTSEILWEKTTKRGNKVKINLCDRLFNLAIIPDSYQTDSISFRCLGSCNNDGIVLHPEHIIYMLETVAKQEFSLIKAHREKLILQSTK